MELLHDDYLGILASTVTDMEDARKALDNRYRQMTRSKEDKDGGLRGLGMDDSSPEVKVIHDLLKDAKNIEHQVILKLNGKMRKHPLWVTWAVNQKGIGEKTFARLLHTIEDPYWNGLHNRPRSVSELWSYCGYAPVDGVATRKTRGQKVTWSPEAKMRTRLLAESCLKQQDYYADVYYEAREKYTNSVHPAACARCGPEKKPALPGSPLSDGHKHARALRIVSKEILKDLWVAAKDLHEQAA